MDTDDLAKARAEARAERELQLKIETLELEREKFQYTRRQSNRDRMSAAGVRGAGALMFAHGSMIVVSLTNYKALTDRLPAKVLHLELWLLGVGLYLATLGFMLVLVVGSVASSQTNRIVRRIFFVGLGFLITSFALFAVVLNSAIRALTGI